MPLFKPNISKMREKGDIKGLIKLLTSERDGKSLVKDTRPLVFETMHALAEIGEPAIEELIKSLRLVKGGSLIAVDIMHTLVLIGEPAVEPVIAALKELPSYGITALLIIGKPAVGIIEILLQDEELPPVVRQLAEAKIQELETAGN